MLLMKVLTMQFLEMILKRFKRELMKKVKNFKKQKMNFKLKSARL